MRRLELLELFHRQAADARAAKARHLHLGCVSLPLKLTRLVVVLSRFVVELRLLLVELPRVIINR